jgi:hypothetical protein
VLALLFACAPTVPPAPAEPPGPPPPPAAPAPDALVFPTAAAAVSHVLATNPRVIGVGEVHATTDGPAIRTTLSRFTTDILPVLAPKASDLVLETWRLDGRCGAPEEQVATQVDADTKRPAATKSELVLLVEAAVALDVRPHDLVLTCAEYTGLLGPDGDVAYDKLLGLVTGKLQDYALRGLDTPDATVVLYGGAVHNDIYPKDGLAPYSYGVAARAKGGAAYVELDLYEPELVRGRDALLEPAWAPLLDRTGPDHVLLYERGPGSYVLLLETTPAVAPEGAR